MLKKQSVVRTFGVLAFVAVLCLPYLVRAQVCCVEKDDDKVPEKAGYLGITGSDPSAGVKKALNIESGTIVETVEQGSPAEKAGIKVGDVIVEINKQKISDFEDLRKMIVASPSAKVNIALFRGGKKTTKEVLLGVKEKKEIKLEMNIPDIDINFADFKDMLGKGTTELKKQLEELKIEVEKLKTEIEKLKNK